MKSIDFLRAAGYPLKIKGNGGYTAYLTDVQPLNDGDFMAIYRYPGGDCCHGLEEIKTLTGSGAFEVLEQ